MEGQAGRIEYVDAVARSKSAELRCNQKTLEDFKPSWLAAIRLEVLRIGVCLKSHTSYYTIPEATMYCIITSKRGY